MEYDPAPAAHLRIKGNLDIGDLEAIVLAGDAQASAGVGVYIEGLAGAGRSVVYYSNGTGPGVDGNGRGSSPGFSVLVEAETNYPVAPDANGRILGYAGALAHTTAYVSGAMGFVTSATGNSSTASLTEFALFFAPPDPFDP